MQNAQEDAQGAQSADQGPGPQPGPVEPYDRWVLMYSQEQVYEMCLGYVDQIRMNHSLALTATSNAAMVTGELARTRQELLQCKQENYNLRVCNEQWQEIVGRQNSELHDVRNRLERLQAANAQLTAENQAPQAEPRRPEGESTADPSDRATLAQLSNARRNIQQLEAELQETRNSNQQLEAQLREMRVAHENLNEDWQKDWDALKEEHDNESKAWDQERRALVDQALADARKWDESREALLTQHWKDGQSWEEERQELLASFSLAEDEKIEMKRQISTLELTNSRQRKEIDQLVGQVKTLQRYDAQCAALCSEVASCATEMRQELKALTGVLKDTQNMLAQAKAKAKADKKQFRHYEDAAKELKQKLSEQSKQIATLEKPDAALEKLKKDYEVIRHRNLKLFEEKSIVLSEYKKLEFTLQKQSETVTKMKATYKKVLEENTYLKEVQRTTSQTVLQNAKEFLKDDPFEKNIHEELGDALDHPSSD